MKTIMWNADLGNGMYKNPILYADYSDPDACRAGEDYFMIASSFCNAPGLPVLHSKDLVNWKVVNYILPKVPEERYDKPVHGCGVWAPAILYHDVTFFACFPIIFSFLSSVLLYFFLLLVLVALKIVLGQIPYKLSLKIAN